MKRFGWWRAFWPRRRLTFLHYRVPLVCLAAAPFQSHNDFYVDFDLQWPQETLERHGGLPSSMVSTLNQVVNFLGDPDALLQDRKAPVPAKVILLHGPAGSGKSMLGKEVAGHAGVPLLLVPSSSLEGPYVGQSEVRVRSIFTQAKQVAQDHGAAVLVFDEADTFMAARPPADALSGRYKRDLTNVFLTELSELKLQDKVVVFLTTNVGPERLDPAIIRPGRVDAVFHLGLPNAVQASDILLRLVTQAGMQLNEEGATELGSLAEGMSGAEIAAWVEATINDAKQRDQSWTWFSSSNSLKLTPDDFLRTFAHVNRMQSSQVFSLQVRKRAALHEACYTVVAATLGQCILKVSLQSSESEGGSTHLVPVETIPLRSQLEDRVAVCLASVALDHVKWSPLELSKLGLGQEANGCVPVQLGRRQDLMQAMQVVEILEAEGCHLDTKFLREQQDHLNTKFLREQQDRALLILQQHKEQVLLIFEALLKQNALTGAQVLRLLGLPQLSVLASEPQVTVPWVARRPRRERKLTLSHPEEHLFAKWGNVNYVASTRDGDNVVFTVSMPLKMKEKMQNLERAAKRQGLNVELQYYSDRFVVTKGDLEAFVALARQGPE